MIQGSPWRRLGPFVVTMLAAVPTAAQEAAPSAAAPRPGGAEIGTLAAAITGLLLAFTAYYDRRARRTRPPVVCADVLKPLLQRLEAQTEAINRQTEAIDRALEVGLEAQRAAAAENVRTLTRIEEKLQGL